MTPLALAILHGSLTVAKLLVSSGAGVMPEDNNDESLLCLAVQSKSDNIELISWLAGVSPQSGDRADFLNARDLTGHAALHYAVGRNLREVAGILLSNGADPNLPARYAPGNSPPGSSPIDMATPLMIAADLPKTVSSDDAAAMVRLLLAYGAATNIPERQHGTYPLHHATQRNDPAVIDLLIDGPTGRPDRRGPVDIGTIAIPNADPHMQGSTPLMHASALAHHRTMRRLLRRGADPNRVNHFGETALHWAAGGHNDDGLNLDSPRSGSSSDDRNERLGPYAIRMLVLGDDPSPPPYTYDARDFDTDDFPPKPGAWPTCDVNARTKLGSTALHAAAWLGRVNNTKTLLELGADTQIVAEGIHVDTIHRVRGTAADYAKLKGHFEVAELIEAHERELRRRRRMERETAGAVEAGGSA
jgi:ankyrin repeat protein